MGLGALVRARKGGMLEASERLRGITEAFGVDLGVFGGLCEGYLAKTDRMKPGKSWECRPDDERPCGHLRA